MLKIGIEVLKLTNLHLGGSNRVFLLFSGSQRFQIFFSGSQQFFTGTSRDRKVAIKFPEYEDRRFCRDSFAIFDLRISCTVSFNLIHVAQVWQAYFYKTGILQLIWSR